MPPVDVSEVGTPIGKIPVSISYRIIDLFSGHLYSNPAKAIEELVVNSYDAFARNCHVVIPENWDAPDARVLVWDDGESMDLNGLKELWLVAESHKRDFSREDDASRRGRLPVGKFGIGKLASYVLGNRITHICKRGSDILAVTMDFSEVVPPDNAPPKEDEPKKISLPVRRLSEPEAKQMLEFARSENLPGASTIPLFGKGAPKNWTLVIVDRFKEAAKRITLGRLRWIIATALPLVPDFGVILNGEEVEPRKESIAVLHAWQIGHDDKAAEALGLTVGRDSGKSPPLDTWVEIEGIGRVSGNLTLYQDSLLGGKAGEVGRSHGFFIMVRHRLINHEDPLIGIHVLSHATFNRLRAVVHADGMDKFLVASRESVSEEPRRSLALYLTAKFNEIRRWYEEYLASSEKVEAIPERLAAVPGWLARFPLRHAIERALRDKAIVLKSIRPPDKDKPIVEGIKGIEVAPLDSTDSLAVFDGSTGTVLLNMNHPFYVNFSDSPDIEVLAVAEILLEAYLYEQGLASEEIQIVLAKRDDLLRALVRRRMRSVVLVAQRLREAVHSEKDLEGACHAAFEALGFEVIPMGGAGGPDGLASAILAVRYARRRGDTEQRSYRITYDAKSSEHDKVKSGNLGLATIARHRDEHEADHAVVVAPEFETSEGDESKAVKEARQENVCLLRARDFADLVEASGAKPLPLDKLKELFEQCRSPEEGHAWIQRFRDESPPRPDLRVVLETIGRLQKENPGDPPSFGAIKYAEPRLVEVPEWQIKDWMMALSRLVPELITVYGEKVELNQSSEYVAEQVKQSLYSMKPGVKGAGL